MISRFLFPVFILCSVFISTALAQKQAFDPTASEYLWPTNASSHLTSTFAETRSQHFHAALDIKTWGRRGYKVFATRDGTVYRVSIGPKGYGKVIYLQHDDGSFSVYAHLLSFNEQLQQLVDEIRIENDYRFEIDQYLSYKNIRVKKGDFIGYSGASGIGPPHLHFELRTPKHEPFNPLLTNLSVKDNIPPQFTALSIEPLSPYSQIEGKNSIQTQRFYQNKGSYKTANISVSGPVGLGVDVFDQSNDVYNAYAVYKLELLVDGEKQFSSRVDKFSYRNTHQMFLDRVYPLLKEKNGSYQRLFIADGNSLPFYQTDTSNGILNLSPGKHRVKIRATDFFGNASTASFTLEVVENESPMLTKDNTAQSSNSDSDEFYRERDGSGPNSSFTTGAKRRTHGTLDPNKFTWFDNWLTLSVEEYNQLTIAAPASRLIKHKAQLSVDLTTTDDLFIQIPGTGALNLRRIYPEKTSFLTTGDGDDKAFVRFPAHTFYDTLSVGVTHRQFSHDSTRIDILPDAYPVRDKYTFYVKRDTALTDTTKLSFYRRKPHDKEEKWEIMPTVFSKDYIKVKTEALGTFVMLKDTTAPALSEPHVRKRADGHWVIMIGANDNLSGIDYRRSKITVNGMRGIAEFEPEDDRFVYYHPDFSPSEKMEVEVTVYDKMGNKKEKLFLLSQHR